jgi:hypothetical protein
MIIEFYYVELMITHWEGEEWKENWWTALNNLLMVVGVLLYSKRAVDYYVINTHPLLKSKCAEIKRSGFLGDIDGKLSFYEIWFYIGTVFFILIACCIRLFLVNVAGTRFRIELDTGKNKTEYFEILDLMKVSNEKNQCSQFKGSVWNRNYHLFLIITYPYNAVYSFQPFSRSINTFQEYISKFTRDHYAAVFQIVYFVCLINSVGMFFKS